MDAEFSQMLADVGVALERAVTNGSDIAAALADIHDLLKKQGEQQHDNTAVVDAINALREELKAVRMPPDERYELVTTTVYDTQDRVIEQCTRRHKINEKGYS